MEAAAAALISERYRWLIGLLILQLMLVHQIAAAFTFDLNEPAEGLEEWVRGEPLEGVASASRMEVDWPPEASQPVVGDGPERSTSMRLWKRARQLLPDYFNYDDFINKFGRSYDQSETCLRRSIFMHKVVEIFKKRIDYRLGRKSYKVAANEFTDKTQSEFKLLFQPAAPPEFSKRASHEELSGSTVARVADSPAAPADEEFSSALRKRSRELKDEQQHQLDLLNEVPSRSCARTTNERELAREQLDKYIEEERRKYASQRDANQMDRLMDMAIREELSGMTFETYSKASAADAARGKRTLPWPGQLSLPEEPMETELANECDQSSRPYVQPQLEAIAKLGNLDWSEHECFHEIYKQKPKCGNCYVFAATTLAEFYACSEGGPNEKWTKRKFSKRYVMDCGQKFTPRMMGCAGGSPLDTLHFMDAAGVHNILSWNGLRSTRLASLLRQLAGAKADPLDVWCPLEPQETPIEQWGSFRVDITPRLVHPNDWMEALEDGPLVVTVQMPAEGVDSYAGGVHDGQDCASSQFFHTMLLVGYGLSDRMEPYWRFRNSFGPSWGDAGHFNLAMDVPGACLVGGVRVYRRPARAN